MQYPCELVMELGPGRIREASPQARQRERAPEGEAVANA